MTVSKVKDTQEEIKTIYNIRMFYINSARSCLTQLSIGLSPATVGCPVSLPVLLYAGRSSYCLE